MLTLVAIPSLALRIGLNAAVFSIIQAVFVRPLPYADADRLVSVAQTHPDYPRLPRACRQPTTSTGDARIMCSRDGCVRADRGVLAGTPGVERVAALRVSAEFYPVLAVPPALGRVFDASDDQPGITTAVVSDALWGRRRHPDPHILRCAVSISGA